MAAKLMRGTHPQLKLQTPTFLTTSESVVLID